jgi:hypothetical protein
MNQFIILLKLNYLGHAIVQAFSHWLPRFEPESGPLPIIPLTVNTHHHLSSGADTIGQTAVGQRIKWTVSRHMNAHARARIHTH